MSQQATSYNSSQQSDTQIYRHKIEKRTSVLAEAEGIVRDGAQHGTLYLLGWNNIANVAIFLKHLVSLETLLSLFLSVTFTVFSYDQTVSKSTFEKQVGPWNEPSYAQQM